MSEIDPQDFGRLMARVDSLEEHRDDIKDQISELRTDIKTLLELANKGKGALWLLMGISSILGALASKILVWIGWLPK